MIDWRCAVIRLETPLFGKKHYTRRLAMAKSKNQPKGARARARRPARALPPPDNPLLRQQEHEVARLKGSEQVKLAIVGEGMKMAMTLEAMKLAHTGARRRPTKKSTRKERVPYLMLTLAPRSWRLR
jgi:hypothetical protein